MFQLALPNVLFLVSMYSFCNPTLFTLTFLVLRHFYTFSHFSYSFSFTANSLHIWFTHSIQNLLYFPDGTFNRLFSRPCEYPNCYARKVTGDYLTFAHKYKRQRQRQDPFFGSLHKIFGDHDLFFLFLLAH